MKDLPDAAEIQCRFQQKEMDSGVARRHTYEAMKEQTHSNAKCCCGKYHAIIFFHINIISYQAELQLAPDFENPRKYLAANTLPSAYHTSEIITNTAELITGYLAAVPRGTTSVVSDIDERPFNHPSKLGFNVKGLTLQTLRRVSKHE